MCQRWRRLVFSSPHRLHIQLFCLNSTPVQEFLGMWPQALPIIIHNYTLTSKEPTFPDDQENLMTAFSQPDRIQQIDITTSVWSGNRLVTKMRKTMTSLESLTLAVSDGRPDLRLPDDFLGGSAPVLSHLSLDGVAFPALPKFLLSAGNLVSLALLRSLRPGHHYPVETLVTGLSALTRLKTLRIYVDLCISPISTERAVLPGLTDLAYHGVLEHFENFVARIDTPLIEHVKLALYSWDAIELPQLCHFIHRTRQLGSPTHVEIQPTHNPSFSLIHHPTTTCGTSPGTLRLDGRIASIDSERYPFHISHISFQLSAFLCDVRQLHIFFDEPSEDEHEDLVKWEKFLRRFRRVEKLSVTLGLTSSVIAQVLGRSASRLGSDPEFLPALHELCIGKFSKFPTTVNDTIEPFIKARQLSGILINAYYIL